MIALLILLAAAPAHATGFTDVGQDLEAHPDTAASVHGALRLRAELLDNLDLDRGPTPSGDPLFPVPLHDPNGQLLFGADLRLRTDLAFYAPGGSVAVKARIDVLDDLVLGSTPDTVPSATTSQRAPDAAAFRVERAYGEALTPVGLFAAGRMGAHWGLGILANGGDCADCDRGDAADRVAFVTPVAGHIWAAAFDWSATGPVGRRADGIRGVDLEPTDDVRTVTFAVLRWRDDRARARRARAGKTTFEYGAYVSHRWQTNDIPAAYLPATDPPGLGPSQVVARHLTATAVDVWMRVTAPTLRVELEAAFLGGRIGDTSLVPGVRLRDAITTTQYGGAIESEWTPAGPVLGLGLDAGFASGDDAPGFGAFPGANDPPPTAGDLDGPQAAVPHDTTVDNFRFHSDYRVDRILFREIVGTVTDAIYVRPHARYTVARFGAGRLDASLAAIASWAVEPTSTPGNARALGVEIDPTLAYTSDDGFALALEHAVLFPLAGLDDPTGTLSARPAQVLRLRAAFVF